MARWSNAGAWLTALALSRCWTTAASRPELDKFGPGDCVGVTRAEHGTCKILTRCSDYNLSTAKLAFVCFNANESVRYALHSFESSEFADEEDFDTGVLCDDCMSVSVAFNEGGPIVRDALAAALHKSELPNSRIWETPGAKATVSAFPSDAAFFGPNSCITTYKSPDGTCTLQTQCTGENLTDFDVGVTCMDRGGGFFRYMFGRGSFAPEEVFDTRIKCQACLAVDLDDAPRKVWAVLPKQLVEDVTALQDEVRRLRNLLLEMRRDGGAPPPEPEVVEWEPAEEKIVVQKPRRVTEAPRPTADDVGDTVNVTRRTTWGIRDGGTVPGKAAPRFPPEKMRQEHKDYVGAGANRALPSAPLSAPPRTTSSLPTQVTSTSIPALVQSDSQPDAGLRGVHAEAQGAPVLGSIPDMPIIYHEAAAATSSLREFVSSMRPH